MICERPEQMSETILQISAKPCWWPCWLAVGFISHIKGIVTVEIQLQGIPRSPKAPIKPSQVISLRSLHKHKSEELRKRRVGKKKEATPPMDSHWQSRDIQKYLDESRWFSAPTNYLAYLERMTDTSVLWIYYCCKFAAQFAKWHHRQQCSGRM